MRRFVALLPASLFAACADVRPDPDASPKLDSGITPKNGGGARMLGNQPNVGITTRTGPTS